MTARPITWRLHADAPKDPVTGKRNQRTRTFHGTLTEAKLAQAAFEIEVRGVQHVATSITVNQLCDVWLKAARGWLEDQTYAAYVSTCKLYIRPHLGQIALRDLRPHHLNAMYQELQVRGAAGLPLAASTIGRIHQTIKAALSYAEDNEWILKNPARSGSTKPPKKIKARPVTPDIAEVATLIEDLAATDPDLCVYVELLACTGARPGEVCGLQWRDVDWSAGVLHISRSVQRDRKVKPTKTDRDRFVALDDTTLGILKDHLPADADPADHIFGGKRPWAPNIPTMKIKEARDRLGLGVIHPRSLRHYVATRLIGSRVDVRTVAGRLGHSNVSTTVDIYADWIPENDRKAADLLRGLRETKDEE
jgi:integrase